MKKVVKLLTVVVLALSIFCVSAMAAGTDDAQMTFMVRDGVKYIGSNPVSWCTFYTAADGSGKVVYSYTSGDTNEDNNTDVCDLVKLNNDKLDFDFDGIFAASDLSLMRDIIFNPSHTHETALDTFQLQMKAEAEAAGASYEMLGRQLVWHDEFDGTDINSDNWEFQNTMYSANHEHINDSEHARVEDGNLHLQIHKSDQEGKTYSMSQGLATTNTMLFKYGYLEMRAKVPYRKGAWSSFWCSSNTPLRTYENTMEVDILEVWSSETGFTPNLHKWSTDGSKHMSIPVGTWGWPSSYTYTFANTSNLQNEYHTYGFEWDPEYMNFYVDGKKFTTFELTGNKGEFANWLGYSSFPETDMFQDWLRVTINNECFAEGDDYATEDNVLTDSDVMPIDYYIDYVRLYQNSDDGETFKTKDEIAADIAGKQS